MSNRSAPGTARSRLESEPATAPTFGQADDAEERDQPRAGVENELFFHPKTMMLFGDAKDSVQKMVTGAKTA